MTQYPFTVLFVVDRSHIDKTERKIKRGTIGL
jgi:hypothetical protein